MLEGTPYIGNINLLEFIKLRRQRGREGESHVFMTTVWSQLRD